MNIEIANRLVELRKKMNLSQEELAEKLGLSRQAVSKWERAEASPDTDNLICLAKIYNISLDDLLKTDQPVDQLIQDVKEQSPAPESAQSVINIEIDSEEEVKSAASITHSIFALLVTIAYIVLGITLNTWGTLWMMFILIPVPGSIIEAIQQKKLSKINIPAMAIFTYLFLGMHLPKGTGWHPYWVIMLIIPLFYAIVRPLEVRCENKKHSK